MTMVDFDLPETMALRPSRRPLVNGSEYRAAMTGMGASVCVAAARRGMQMSGRTVTSWLSLSAQPPVVLISIDIVSRLADFIVKTDGFSLALLAREQEDVADAFAGKKPPAERFDQGEWGRWPSGQPLLHDTVASFDCDVIGAIETGTHVLFAGAVVEVQSAPERMPLIWQRHGYRGLADPETAAD